MLRKCFPLLLVAALAVEPAAHATEPQQPKHAVVIPIRAEIAEPALYILRRGLKEAEAQGADVVILDLKTPGGALDVTQDMMEALGKFHGQTIAYVDNEAMSAGAFISAVTGEIWFSPDGVIGAAAPVSATGQDVDSTMKQKIVSYLKARIRANSEGKGYRGEVISAMIDSDYELKIDGQVVKAKGELLSLTATEAMKTYGKPARPLLGSGIAADIDSLLAQKFGARGTIVRHLEITWSERLAVGLNRVAPALLGLGLLALFVEFKMGGFGLIGAVGVGFLILVFLANHVAGLSGHEPILLFGLGVVLLALELIFFHSAGFLGVIGAVLMLTSLVWSMADLWPNEPLAIAWSADAFARPIATLGFGLAIAVAGGVALLKFLPHGWIWDRLVVGATVSGTAQGAGSGARHDALVGRRGIAATALRPGGQVEVDGRRYEATVEVGTLERGASIIVSGRTDFGLIVQKADGAVSS